MNKARVTEPVKGPPAIQSYKKYADSMKTRQQGRMLKCFSEEYIYICIVNEQSQVDEYSK